MLDFDDSTAESAELEAVLPRNYAGGGITVQLYWMASTATTGNCAWGGAFERHDEASTDLDSDSFATEQTATEAAPGTTGQIQVTSIAFTDGAQIDSLAIGESFRFRVRRVAADVGDTMLGDAELLRIEARET